MTEGISATPTDPRYLGLDFGDATIGIAVSCPRAIVATGVETLRRSDPAAMKPAIARLRELINHYGITHIVLGNPLHMDGNPSARSEKTFAFAERLARNFKRLTLEFWDERLSTHAVKRTLQHAQRVDEMAATFILQGFLDAKNNTAQAVTKENQMENQAQHPEQLIMTDDDGTEYAFDILATREMNGILYLLAADTSDEDEAEIIHFKNVASEGEDLIFEPVEEDSDEFDWMIELFAADYEALGVELELEE
ncbi:MAG: Holliday junction resolvase RuvX [Defluviitaleaceae bacterium]|nr:Holliday junction resolvase RuvX [Defluviitaleaceae bacterium]